MDRRHTIQREIVLKTVRRLHTHVTADDVYGAVRAEFPAVGRGTVYRNLGLLSDGGDVYHIRAPGADRYDLRTDPHDHILCIHCKKVVDAPDTERPERDAEVAAATGYRIFRHQTIFEGLCPDCQNAAEHDA